MLKKERGSITVLAYVAMLFVSLYGAILLANASRKYNIQLDEIKSIQKSYDYEMSDTDLINMYKNIGGQEINY